MTDAQFCLEWDSHNRNICTGLSSLQQNGEFVDMTLAADGHHVKVHQMVLALASPYIKELISSANCPHPVIFLNKVSYKTLCSILEYIYTGQAQVSVEDINELIFAAKELHIKGLEDVKSVAGEPTVSDTEQPSSFVDEQPSEYSDVQIKLQHKNPAAPTPVVSKLTALKRRLAAMEKTPSTVPLRKRSFPPKDTDSGTNKDMPALVKDDDGEKSFGYDDPLDDDPRDDGDDYCTEDTQPVKKANTAGQPDNAPNVECSLQYTVSNQGAVQLILNRYMYSLNYRYRDNRRQWKCVDGRDYKCPAKVVTKDNLVVRRVSAHTHEFHDHKILKKVMANCVFSAIHEAEASNANKKENVADTKTENV